MTDAGTPAAAPGEGSNRRSERMHRNLWRRSGRSGRWNSVAGFGPAGDRRRPPRPASAAHLGVLGAACLIGLALSSGCAAFPGGRSAPRYIRGTRIEIRELPPGRAYVVEIGGTETTVFEAALTAGGESRMGFRYEDDYPLYVRRMEIHTYNGPVFLAAAEPEPVEEADGRIVETGLLEAPVGLFEAIMDAPEPLLALIGDGGTVMFEPSDQAKARLAELIAYEAERFGPKGR